MLACLIMQSCFSNSFHVVPHAFSNKNTLFGTSFASYQDALIILIDSSLICRSDLLIGHTNFRRLDKSNPRVLQSFIWDELYHNSWIRLKYLSYYVLKRNDNTPVKI